MKVSSENTKWLTIIRGQFFGRDMIRWESIVIGCRNLWASESALGIHQVEVIHGVESGGHGGSGRGSITTTRIGWVHQRPVRVWRSTKTNKLMGQGQNWKVKISATKWLQKFHTILTFKLLNLRLFLCLNAQIL